MILSASEFSQTGYKQVVQHGSTALDGFQFLFYHRSAIGGLV
jgi:hypothetical protein